jgi:predicted component of type VI protein secretion system
VSVGVVFLTSHGEPELGVLLSGRSILIGRDEAAGLRLPEPTVSPRHASLKKRGRVYLLTDEGSKNGTVVHPLGATGPVVLGPDCPRVILAGDRVFLGNVALEFWTEETSDPERDVRWLDHPNLVPRALVRRALEQLGEEPPPEAIDEALRELFASPEEGLAHSRKASRAARPPEQASPSQDPLPPPPVPVDLALSLIALGLAAVAGTALYRLVVSGAVTSP